MDVRLLSVQDLTGAMQDRWRALVGEALEPNPTFEPEALLSASRHHPAWADLRLLVVSAGDRFVACLPVRTVAQWRRLPVRAFTTRPDDGPVPLLPVLGTPLVSADAAAPALRSLLSALAAGQIREAGADPRRPPSVLVVERWNDEGPVAAAWRGTCQTLGLPLQIVDAWQRPILRCSADNAATWPASLGRRRLSDAERCCRRLSEQVGEVRWVDRWEDPTAVDDYLALEGSGWKGRAGTAMGTAPQQAAAFRAMCAHWAAQGRLSMLTLEAGGRPLAILCSVRSGNRLFMQRKAYDETFARFGPGVLMELSAGAHWLAHNGLEWVDPCCAASNTLYPTFFPDRLPVATAVTGLGTVGRAGLAGLALAVPTAKRIRGGLRRVLATPRTVPDAADPPVPSTAATSSAPTTPRGRRDATQAAAFAQSSQS